MDLGVIGSGRMGTFMVRRPMTAGHRCVVCDRQPQAVQALADEGAVASDPMHDPTAILDRPRAAWLMVPATAVDAAPQELPQLLEGDDVVIDGRNSCHRDDIRRNEAPGGEGVHYLDVGTGGGVWGAERGHLRCGPSGTRRFVQMIHNGIEYGMMAAYAEVPNMLRHADAGRQATAGDAETAPLTRNRSSA